MAAFTYDPETGTYLDEDEDPVAFARVLAALAAIIAGTQARLAVLGQRRADGMDPIAWEHAVEDELQDAHLAAAALAAGGAAAVTAAMRALLDQRLAVQFGYLAGFAAVLAGQPFDGAALTRLHLYADAIWGTFEAVRRLEAQDRGVAVERNVLGSTHPCGECPELSAQGWVPVGTLPLPGDRICITRCKCHLEYDIVAPEEVA